MRIVVTHDFFETFGGAERVTAEIAATFPDAPVHAILGRRSVATRMGIEDRVQTILPSRHRLQQHYRGLAPADPWLVRRARLPKADLVISSSYAYAHGFGAANGAPKLCYSHGPVRHLWSQPDIYAAHLPGGGAVRHAFGLYVRAARAADRGAAESIDRFLTQSPFTAELIARSYGCRAEIVPPPVNCDLFRPSGRPAQGYFLFVGRLVEAYKRPSVVIDAFAQMPDRQLLIAGDGPALDALRRRATDNVEFLGGLSDHALVEAMQGCEAVVFPSVDDFGLVPLEANACGRPVLALGAGGALHTVKPGVSGELFAEQSAAAVVRAVRAFDARRYDTPAIRRHALQWDARRFRSRIQAAAHRLVDA
jgi:glycosyltransferase involved in cell wall biosynthesis